MPKHKVIFSGPPTVDDGLVRALMGTDVKGLVEQILRGEYDHILNLKGGQAVENQQRKTQSDF